MFHRPSFWSKALPVIFLRDVSQTKVYHSMSLTGYSFATLTFYWFLLIGKSVFKSRWIFWQTLIFDTSLRGTTGKFFDENESPRNTLQHTWCDSTFDADLKYSMFSNQKSGFSRKNQSKITEKLLFLPYIGIVIFREVPGKEILINVIVVFCRASKGLLNSV